MSNYPSSSNQSDRQVMVKNATQGGFAIAGGVAISIFNGLAGISLFGIHNIGGLIIGGALLIGGLVMRGKGSKGDKLSSLAMIGLGGVAVASALPFVGGLASFLMGASAVGLIGFGAWKLWQYFKGMKGRS